MENRILVVSDDTQFRQAVGVALSMQGHIVTLAAGVAQALEEAEMVRPHVLVTDLIIDGQACGLVLATQLKRTSPRLRCLLVQDGPRVESGGADSPLTWVYPLNRPFSMVRFAAVADEALKQVASDSTPVARS